MRLVAAVLMVLLAGCGNAPADAEGELTQEMREEMFVKLVTSSDEGPPAPVPFANNSDEEMLALGYEACAQLAKQDDPAEFVLTHVSTQGTPLSDWRGWFWVVTSSVLCPEVSEETP